MFRLTQVLSMVDSATLELFGEKLNNHERAMLLREIADKMVDYEHEIRKTKAIIERNKRFEEARKYVEELIHSH